MGDAFSLERLSDGVFRIQENYVDPWLRANIWLIPGRDAALLIDSGMGLWPLKDFIREQVQKPVLCLSTHCHFDHAGGAHEFSERMSHPSEATVLEKPDRGNVLIERFIRPDIFPDNPDGRFQAETYCIEPCAPTRPVNEGDVIDLGDRRFGVIHLPGHSPGSIGVREGSRLLFSGDAVYDGELYDDYYHSNADDFRESMFRLKEMPFETVHAGHYGSFGNERLTELANDYLNGRRSQDCPSSGPTGPGNV